MRSLRAMVASKWASSASSDCESGAASVSVMGSPSPDLLTDRSGISVSPVTPARKRRRAHRRPGPVPAHVRGRPTVTRLLESYAAGRWYAASAEGDPLLDAATGEEVARISSAGLDIAAMTHHARSVGGPAIRELTFHERALLLKELATHLTSLKEEVYDLSLRTGATRRDSLIDVDGGFGTMFSLSSKGR